MLKLIVSLIPLLGASGILYETLEVHSAHGDPLESESDSVRRTINVIARDNVYSSEVVVIIIAGYR